MTPNPSAGVTTDPHNVPSDIDPEETKAPAGRKPEPGSHRPAPSGVEDDHVGATEDQIAPVTPPKGAGFEDEPKQG